MPSRTQTFTLIPWTGGKNDSIDPGLLPANDLVEIDNVVFTTSGARIKREAFNYFDTDIPAVTFRASSGTTRTLTFASTITGGGTDQLFVVGEILYITTTTTSGNEFTYYTTTTATVASIPSATTLTYTGVGSLSESTTATSTLTVKRGSPYIGVHDYWYSDTSDVKQQVIVAVSAQGKIFRYNTSGNRIEIEKDATATALSSPTIVNFEVMNENLIMAFDGAANTPKTYHPDTDAQWLDMTGTPPNFSVMRQHQGRLFTNDKTNRDRLHYSPPGVINQWNGTGDSGALDIFPGDGDQEGIVAIHHPFRGQLFIGKFGKLYRLLGDNPENYTPELVTGGLGSLAQKAVASIDLDDQLFLSARGIHSLAATDQFGDFDGEFLSRKMQNTFKTFVSGRLKFTQCAYIPDLNSILFTVTEDGQSVQSAIWGFNTLNKEWFRFNPSIDAQCMSKYKVGVADRLMCGNSYARLMTPEANLYTDFETTPYNYRIKSGSIYPDQRPDSWKGFKKFTLYYKPKGTFTITVTIKIDNQADQAITFSNSSGGDRLGTSFRLGTSILGSSNVLAPYTQSIDGFGRGCTVEVEASGTGEQIEIYGFGIEYEPTGKAPQETVESTS
jgi:hypothetical protein